MDPGPAAHPPAEAVPERGGWRRVQPGSALRPGRFDAIALLILWAGRRAFWPMLLLGILVAFGLGRLEAENLAELTTPMELLHAVLSPLGGIALAFLTRLVVGWLALALAWPLSRWDRPPDHGHSLSVRWRDWVDRLRLAQAYRTLRWTWGVREAAIARAGAIGQRLGWAVPLSTIVTIVLWIALIAMVAVSPGPAAA